jgi:hypothetical protein
MVAPLMRLASLAVSALLLVPALSQAGPRDTPAGAASPSPGWAILLASAPQRDEAEARLRAMHEARAFAFVKPANGFPKILESSALPGLRPGLHVVVLGVCGVQSEALAAQARVRPELSDAYVKKLSREAQQSQCPSGVSASPNHFESWLSRSG